MRMIDADRLKEIVQSMSDTYEDDWGGYERMPASLKNRVSECRKIIEEIDEAPDIDSVFVVRCRDCKHYHASIGWCNKLSFFQTSDGEPCSQSESMDWKTFAENDFCSMGERR